MSVEVHEASHCAAALLLGRRVEHVWREVGHSLVGDTVGQCKAPIGDRIEASQVPIAVIG
jgi:hypothetical protein